MTDVGGNFDAQTHQELYSKIHSSGNGSAVDATNEAWQTFRALMGNAKAEVESALRDANAVWTGPAGEAFSGGMAPLVQWAEDTRAAGVATHNAFLAQRSYYVGTRDRMPEPVRLSSTANDDFLGIPAGMTHLLGGQTDQDVEERKAHEAKREAVRVMDSYRSGAAEAAANLGTFVEPPKVTFEVAQPAVEPSTEQRQYGQQFQNRDATNSSTADQSTLPTTRPGDVATPTAPVRDEGDTHKSELLPQKDVRPTSPPPTQSPTAGSPTTVAAAAPLTHSGHLSSGRTPTDVGGPQGSGGRPAGQVGRGRASDIGLGSTQTSGRPSAGFSTNRAGAGLPGMGLPAIPQRGQDEQDKERETPHYLEEIEDIWGEDSILAVPPVLGDDQQ